MYLLVLESDKISNALKLKCVKSRSITDFLSPLPSKTNVTTVPVDVFFSFENLPAPDEEATIASHQQNWIDIVEVITENLNDDEKIKVIENVWKPQCDYMFPQKGFKGKRTKACQYSWLEKFDWLVYSKSKDALFCMSVYSF